MTEPPEPPKSEDHPRGQPRVGVDEWVAQAEGRTLGRGLAGVATERIDRLPPALRLLLLFGPLVFVPLLVSSDFIMQVALDTLLYVLLALGLNVAVGFAGMLDLGYVAFYGFGAYAYAWLASDHFDVHWPAQAVVPLVVVASAVLGFVVGLPSRRLFGDYLAIVTLFFLQIFLTVLLNADRLDFPFTERQVNLTRGPNGISTVDSFNLFGYRITTLDQYFYLALITAAVVLAGLYLLNESRTGRAWRALRDDPLAAELMSMPVNRLRLLAFAFGAAVAGLAGTIFAAEQESVFPVNFDLTLLIILYAMVILGGSGSLVGVALGAVAINVSLEALRTPSNASWLFYGLLLVLLPAVLRPWKRWAAVLAAVAAFGFAVHAFVDAIWSRGTAGATIGEAWIDRLLDAWVLLPRDPELIGKWAYVVLILAVLGLTLLKGQARTAAFVPVLYLAACVWENVLLQQPAVARYIMLGAMLVVLMAVRPQGFLGKTRVEIV